MVMKSGKFDFLDSAGLIDSALENLRIFKKNSNFKMIIYRFPWFVQKLYFFRLYFYLPNRRNAFCIRPRCRKTLRNLHHSETWSLFSLPFQLETLLDNCLFLITNGVDNGILKNIGNMGIRREQTYRGFFFGFTRKRAAVVRGHAHRIAPPAECASLPRSCFLGLSW